MESKEHQKHLDKLLIYNVKYNKLNDVSDLIYLGANVDAKDEEGVPVLALAAENGQFKMVELLVKEGADILKKDKDGISVFDRLTRKIIQKCISPEKGDALLYMTAVYLKNVFEGQNRYNGKRNQVVQSDFVMSIVKSRMDRYMALRVGDKEHC